VIGSGRVFYCIVVLSKRVLLAGPIAMLPSYCIAAIAIAFAIVNWTLIRVGAVCDGEFSWVVGSRVAAA
jgi:hypothetical protein